MHSPKMSLPFCGVSRGSTVAGAAHERASSSADPVGSVAVYGSGSRLSDKSKYRETSNMALNAVNNLALVPFLMAFLSSRDRLPLAMATSSGAPHSFLSRSARAASDVVGCCHYGLTLTKPSVLTDDNPTIAYAGRWDALCGPLAQHPSRHWTGIVGRTGCCEGRTHVPCDARVAIMGTIIYNN